MRTPLASSQVESQINNLNLNQHEGIERYLISHFLNPKIRATCPLAVYCVVQNHSMGMQGIKPDLLERQTYYWTVNTIPFPLYVGWLSQSVWFPAGPRPFPALLLRSHVQYISICRHFLPFTGWIQLECLWPVVHHLLPNLSSHLMLYGHGLSDYVYLYFHDSDHLCGCHYGFSLWTETSPTITLYAGN